MCVWACVVSMYTVAVLCVRYDVFVCVCVFVLVCGVHSVWV